jgi:hypothetical protein
MDLLFIGIPYRIVNRITSPFNLHIDNMKGLMPCSSGASSATIAIENWQEECPAQAFGAVRSKGGKRYGRTGSLSGRQHSRE